MVSTSSTTGVSSGSTGGSTRRDRTWLVDRLAVPRQAQITAYSEPVAELLPPSDTAVLLKRLLQRQSYNSRRVSSCGTGSIVHRPQTGIQHQKWIT